jgi:hypothetical protein
MVARSQAGRLLAVLLAPLAIRAEVRSFTLSQAHAALPQVLIYTAAASEPDAPFYDGRITATLGGRPLRIGGSGPFSETGAGVAYVAVVDVSKSLPPEQFGQLRDALREQIGKLRPPDRMAVITFGDQVKLACDFTADRAQLAAAVDALAPTDGSTVLHAAIVRAMGMAARRDPDLPTRRVALLFSDGKDEGSGQTVEDVVEVIREHHLPLYALGFSTLPRAERQKYLAVLHRFATLSGGLYLEAGATGWQAGYKSLRESVLAVRVTEAFCDGCGAEGGRARLQVTLTADGKVLTDGADLRLLPGEKAQTDMSPPTRREHLGIWLLAAAAVLLGFTLFVFFRKSRRTAAPLADAAPSGHVPGPATQPESVPPLRAAPQVRLAVVRGASPGQTFDVRLDREILVGRSPECDLTVDGDDTMSGRHFRLFLAGSRLVVEDAGSANGTAVNGAPISGEYPLTDGDLIAAGHTQLRISMEETAP